MCSDFRRAESGTELLARLEGRSSLKEVEPHLFADEDLPVHGDILEFHGPEGTGKTEMLYHLTARCILPKSEGGLQIEVVFIDTDYHFDLLRLVTILEHRLSQSSEDAVKSCLGRFFLVSCSSSTQLLLTLHSLEALFCSHPSLCLLIVDSLSAFYWTDRANGGERTALQEATLKQCSQLLDRLVREYRLLLFAATQSIMQKACESAEESSETRPSKVDMDYRPYLCKAWQHMVKHRVLFSREDSPKSSGRFTLVSRHLKSNRLQKHFFMIRESGVEFC
ncbi:DNA repair protein XRCC2 isoform X2 [Nannospalax galili]|uniref:X-ray repair complementing defective repair in Chinese hamster cells 2 n=1 Tax=Nannospalax galili TaxID=1026970 RepID=A0A8C6R9X1_NANGA|nr:DNA repair protein XRCC2 isoform X2 [Nannospalax galili]